MWRRKGLFHLIGKLQSIMKVNDRNTEARADAETMGEWYLLACSHVLPSLLSYRTQDQKWHWDPCGALSSQSRKVPPQTNLMEATSQLRFLNEMGT